MPELLHVAIVRLCECDGNLKDLVSRHGRLTANGRRQAFAARDRLTNLGIQAWFSPNNSACQETAEILSGGISVHPADEFREPPYPQWAGLTQKEVSERWPEECARYWNPQLGDADRIIVPGGEPLRVTYGRAKEGLARLYREFRDTGAVGIVTHGEVFRLLTVGLLGAPLEHLFRLRGRNGAVSIFDFDGQVPKFECINETSHLVGLTSQDVGDRVAKLK